MVDFLEHYGVKGMKWGVRKRSVPRQGPSDDAKEAHKAFVKAKTSGPEALSNKEIQKLNARLKLETEYVKLSYNPSTAKRLLDSIFSTGKTVNDAVNFAASPSGQVLQATLTAKAGSRGAAAKSATKAVITPKKG